MNTNKTIRKIKALKKAILADGKVDWQETDELLKVIRPLAAKNEFLFQDYERLLEKCRADGQITPEESQKLALQLEYLCGYFMHRHLRCWVVILSVLLILSGAVVLFVQLAHFVL